MQSRVVQRCERLRVPSLSLQQLEGDKISGAGGTGTYWYSRTAAMLQYMMSSAYYKIVPVPVVKFQLIEKCENPQDSLGQPL